jgi:hypothetical protein
MLSDSKGQVSIQYGWAKGIGKSILSFISTVTTHIKDAVAHITAAERTTWNNKISKDSGTVSLANLDTTTATGVYNFLDTGGTFGEAGALWNLEVVNSTYGTNVSITQRITQTYTATSKMYVRTYYQTLGTWTVWKQIAEIDAGQMFFKDSGYWVYGNGDIMEMTKTPHSIRILGTATDTPMSTVLRNTGSGSTYTLYNTGNITNGDAAVSGTLANGAIYMEW